MNVAIPNEDTAALVGALEWMLAVGGKQAQRVRVMADDSAYAEETRASFLHAAVSRERQLSAVRRLYHNLRNGESS